ncbi:MAG: hypothetical protein IJM51_07210 [Clostridia bacterium]|nr:hypothetical protein [Clostridia bacterium]
MFYIGEIAALLICWLFYCEFYWMIEQKVLKACSRQYIDKRCRSFADRLFFTPVSGKAKLGFLYYFNRILVYYLTVLTFLHIVLGWSETIQGFVRILTTLTVIGLGITAAAKSPSSTENICTNLGVSSKKNILLLKILSFASIILLMIVYLYFTWAYLG